MPTIRDEIFRLYPLHAQRIIEETLRQNCSFHNGTVTAAQWLDSCAAEYQPIIGFAFCWWIAEEGSQYWGALDARRLYA